MPKQLWSIHPMHTESGEGHEDSGDSTTAPSVISKRKPTPNTLELGRECPLSSGTEEIPNV